MNFKLEDIWTKTSSRIVAVSTIANLALLYFIAGAKGLPSDFMISGAAYIALSLVLINIVKFKNLDSRSYFIIGGAISLAYNGIGSFFGLFAAPTTMGFIFAALQQAIITFGTAKLVFKIK